MCRMEIPAYGLGEAKKGNDFQGAAEAYELAASTAVIDPEVQAASHVQVRVRCTMPCTSVMPHWRRTKR